MAGSDQDDAFTHDGAAGAQLEAEESEGEGLLAGGDDEIIAEEEGEI